MPHTLRHFYNIDPFIIFIYHPTSTIDLNYNPLH